MNCSAPAVVAVAAAATVVVAATAVVVATAAGEAGPQRNDVCSQQVHAPVQLRIRLHPHAAPPPLPCTSRDDRYESRRDDRYDDRRRDDRCCPGARFLLSSASGGLQGPVVLCRSAACSPRLANLQPQPRTPCPASRYDDRRRDSPRRDDRYDDRRDRSPQRSRSPRRERDSSPKYD